eukprot:7341419-Prymnesium_polylepis.1
MLCTCASGAEVVVQRIRLCLADPDAGPVVPASAFVATDHELRRFCQVLPRAEAACERGTPIAILAHKVERKLAAATTRRCSHVREAELVGREALQPSPLASGAYGDALAKLAFRALRQRGCPSPVSPRCAAGPPPATRG